jgi:UDP-N-acetylmuramate--alanine ligase
MFSKSVKKQNIYGIGIKGVGLTMLAQFLAEQGHRVTGSDIKDVFLTDKVLAESKIKVFSPFSIKNIPPRADLIIYSSAYNENNNPELAYLRKNSAQFPKTRLLSYAEALGAIFNSYNGLAVVGSHGKTTTSAWLGYVLSRAGKKPNVLVGSRVPQFKGSSLAGDSRHFIAEVDEYQNKLQYFNPHGVVLNNIDYDHPDFFKTKNSYARVFADFIKKIPAAGFLIINDSDVETRRIKKYCRGKIISYNLASRAPRPAAVKRSTVKKFAVEKSADYIAYDLKIRGSQQSFRLRAFAQEQGEFFVSLLGEHNILNALAVIAAARELKVSWSDLKKYLAGFRGTERRAQILGKYGGALIIDDYAHHPTEIKATLAGLRARYPQKNLITVFHPHTCTRTKALFKDFTSSFTLTDELVILDIYGSAREKQGGVSSRQLAAVIDRFNKLHKIEQKVRAIGTILQASAYLRSRLKESDVLVLMGAGDVFRIGKNLLALKD